MATIKSITRRDGRTGEIAERWQIASAVPSAAPAEPLPEPTKAEMIGHAGEALAKWAKRGFRIAPPERRAARYAACLACELWDDKARFGFGKCKHPDCGCTRLKLALATEQCPLGKWPGEQTSSP